MIIKSLNGTVLYESTMRSFKSALEEAVLKGVDLNHGNFRGQRLFCAKLDGIKACGASFWGADCRGADMASADLREADFRLADLGGACLAESICSGANFAGAYIGGAVLRHCDMAGSFFTCPSIFSTDYDAIDILDGAIYSHKGEADIRLKHLPIVVKGLSRPLILAREGLIWGGEFKTAPSNDPYLRADLSELHATISRFI